MNIQNVAVIGAGTMGNGIAHVFALHDFSVCLCDVEEEILKKALHTIEKNLWRMVAKERISEFRQEKAIENIITCTSIREAVYRADLVIEAVPEDIETKSDIFRNIDQFVPQRAILATNTSSLSITKLASVVKRPEQFIGMHFMNPVPVMKLVEIIQGYSTSDEVTAAIVQTTGKLDKEPIVVKDYPGFVSNRILMPMINEAIQSLFEGVAGVREIDHIMKLGMAHPMGPLELADFIGLDVCLSVMKILYHGLGHSKYFPCPLLVQMVDAGKFGKKSGEGFYDYTGQSDELKISNQFQ